MIYVPYSVQFVSEMDESHPLVQEMLDRAGENLPNVLASMLEEILSEEVFPKINDSSSFARVLTMESIASEFMVKDVEEYIKNETP